MPDPKEGLMQAAVCTVMVFAFIFLFPFAVLAVGLYSAARCVLDL